MPKSYCGLYSISSIRTGGQEGAHIFGKVTWSSVLFDVLNSEMMGIEVGLFARGVATVSDYISSSHSRGRGPSREIRGSRCMVRMF